MIHLNNVSYKDYEGSILKSLYCGDFKVLKIHKQFKHFDRVC